MTPAETLTEETVAFLALTEAAGELTLDSLCRSDGDGVAPEGVWLARALYHVYDEPKEEPLVLSEILVAAE